jgi:hypothetical protein
VSAAIGLAARIVLAAVFLYAAAAKLRAPRTLLTTLVPLLEITLAVWLLVDRASARPAIAVGVTLVAFTVVLVRAELRHEPCLCFGGGATARPVGPAAIVRNGVLLGLSVLAGVDVTGAELGPTLLATAVLGAIAGGAVYVSRD